jgi:hypothetical protein
MFKKLAKIGAILCAVVFVSCSVGSVVTAWIITRDTGAQTGPTITLNVQINVRNHDGSPHGFGSQQLHFSSVGQVRTLPWNLFVNDAQRTQLDSVPNTYRQTFSVQPWQFQNPGNFITSGTIAWTLIQNQNVPTYQTIHVSVFRHPMQPPPIQQLPTPTGLIIVGTRLQWNPVPNASSYSVFVNGAERWQTTGMGVDLLNQLNIFLPGTYELRVRANGNGVTHRDSLLSAPVFYTIPPAAPSILRVFVEVRTANGVVTQPRSLHRTLSFPDPGSLTIVPSQSMPWHLDVANAQRTERWMGTIDQRFTSNVAPGQSVTGGTITWNKTGPWGITAEVTYTIHLHGPQTLLPPNPPIIQGHTMTWTGGENNSGFGIYVNGLRVGQTPTNVRVFNLASLSWRLGRHQLQVRTLGNNTTTANSALSAPAGFEVFGVATAPRNPVITANTLSWVGHEDDTTYHIYVDGKREEEHVAGTSFDLNELDLPAGVYSVQVVAAGDDDLLLNSVPSDEVIFEVEPEDDEIILDQVTGLAINGTMLSWTAVDHALGYRIYVNGVARGAVTHPTTQFDLDTLDPKLGFEEHNIRVRALGDYILFIDGGLSDVELFVITPPPLLTPINLEVFAEELTWCPVAGATGYRVYIDGTLTAVVEDPSFDLAALDLGPGEYIIQIIAITNSPNFVPSAPSFIAFSINEIIEGPAIINSGDNSDDGNNQDSPRGSLIAIIVLGSLAFIGFVGMGVCTFLYFKKRDEVANQVN